MSRRAKHGVLRIMVTFFDQGLSGRTEPTGYFLNFSESNYNYSK